MPSKAYQLAQQKRALEAAVQSAERIEVSIQKLDQLIADAQEMLGLLDAICDKLGIEVVTDDDNKSAS